MKYTMDRVPAFVNAFKPLDDVIVACGAGAIALGFPVVTNETENIFRVPKSLIVQEDVSKFNATSLEARDIKIKVTKIRYPGFLRICIRGRDYPSRRYAGRVRRFPCGLLRAGCRPRMQSEVEDHKITVIGPDFDELEVGSKQQHRLTW